MLPLPTSLEELPGSDGEAPWPGGCGHRCHPHCSQGLLHESGPQRAVQLARDLTALGEQAVQSPLSSPGLKRDATAVEEATPLTEAAAHQYRALAARGNFLCLDCPDLGVRRKGVLQEDGRPDLSGLGRAGAPDSVPRRAAAAGLRVSVAGPGVGLSTHADADFAGCVITRKSTPGGMCMRGAHLLKHWPNTQKTIALSSVEA